MMVLQGCYKGVTRVLQLQGDDLMVVSRSVIWQVAGRQRKLNWVIDNNKDSTRISRPKHTSITLSIIRRMSCVRLCVSSSRCRDGVVMAL
jgi:hypothetical protein